MQILQTARFKKTAKKLFSTQKKELDQAVRDVMTHPEVGELKKGDLSHIRVYKFKIQAQLFLLAYTYEAEIVTLTLLALGSHENFYRDLKCH